MSKIWLYFSIVMIVFVLQGDWGFLVKKNSKVEYLSFQGDYYELYAWEGKYVTFLTPQSDLDSLVMEQIIAITDSGYAYLKELSGQEPLDPHGENSSKTVIAIVDYSCGIGCGFLGYKGIEITREKFSHIYETMKEKGQFDTLLFYELGRNFWFYNEQLYAEKAHPDIQALRKGFAIFTRHLLVEELCIKASAVNGQVYAEYAEMTYQLYPHYRAIDTIDFQYFLAKDIRFKKFVLGNRIQLSSVSSRFWASLFLYLHHHPDYGLVFIQKLLKQFENMPPAANGDEVIVNFVDAFEHIDSHKNLEWIRNMFPKKN